MSDFWPRVARNLISRIHGPLTFRLILQPLVAAIAGLRAGLRDAREHRPIFFWSLFHEPANRRERLKSAWGDLARLFLVVASIDVLYQLRVFHWVYPGETLLVCTALAIVPYVLIRGPTNRVARFFARRRPKEPGKASPGRRDTARPAKQRHA
jgi:hypothetical protein